MGERIDFFLFERHRLPLFINCDRQAVLCSMFVFLFCNCFVPFVPLISSPNCTLFFSVFVNFIFSNFKTILLCLHVIPLVNSFTTLSKRIKKALFSRIFRIFSPFDFQKIECGKVPEILSQIIKMFQVLLSRG